MTLKQLKLFKKSGEKIACLTAYDASFAQLFDACGIDIILIGDSLGSVIQGGENTLSVCMQDMLYHTKSVAKSVQNALLIADLPYQSYQTPASSLKNATALIAAGAQMIKLEGGKEHIRVFEILQKNNIKVCGHLGLLPQSISKISDYKVQGRDEKSAAKITKDALLLESLGIEALILECVPAILGQNISQSLNIPVIGIGAGLCDGQVLVSYDMLGISSGKMPRFVKNFLVNSDIKSAVKAFISVVKNQTFPASEHTY